MTDSDDEILRVQRYARANGFQGMLALTIIALHPSDGRAHPTRTEARAYVLQWLADHPGLPTPAIVPREETEDLTPTQPARVLPMDLISVELLDRVG